LDCNLIGPNASVSGTIGAVGIEIDGGTRQVISHNKLTGFGWGIEDTTIGATDTEISFNWLQRMTNEGILLGGHSKTRIIGNRIDSVGTTSLHHGIYISGGTQLAISQNQISNTSGFGITMHNGTANRTMDDISVQGNNITISGTGPSGLRGGIEADANRFASSTCKKISISSNTITSLAGVAGISIDSCQDVTITGNVLRDLGASEGIQVVSTFATNNIDISGNVIDTNTTASGLNGIHIGPARASLSTCSITANQISNIALSGIYLDGATDCIVSRNSLGALNQRAAVVAGILLFHSTLRNIVTGNRIVSTGAGAAIQVAAAADTDNAVTGNILLGAATPGIADSGTRTIIFGNKVGVQGISDLGR
jgi:hypothetical protein